MENNVSDITTIIEKYEELMTSLKNLRENITMPIIYDADLSASFNQSLINLDKTLKSTTKEIKSLIQDFSKIFQNNCVHEYKRNSPMYQQHTSYNCRKCDHFNYDPPAEQIVF